MDTLNELLRDKSIGQRLQRRRLLTYLLTGVFVLLMICLPLAFGRLVWLHSDWLAPLLPRAEDFPLELSAPAREYAVRWVIAITGGLIGAFMAIVCLGPAIDRLIRRLSSVIVFAKDGCAVFTLEGGIPIEHLARLEYRLVQRWGSVIRMNDEAHRWGASVVLRPRSRALALA